MFDSGRAGREPLCPVRAECQKARASLVAKAHIIASYHVVFIGLQGSCDSVSELTNRAKGSYWLLQGSSFSLGQSRVLTA